MKKYILLFVLFFSAITFSQTNFETGGLKYTATSASPPLTVRVTGRTMANTDTEIEIPDVVTHSSITYNVTSIGFDAFRDNQLTSVAIGNSVISIARDAFSNNQLTTVTIPDSVTSIGIDAFFKNKLSTVTIGNSVTSISHGAFFNNQLETVTIGNSIESIGDRAFLNNQLTTVTIPDSVTSIGFDAFKGNQLTTVTIGNSVTSIGGNAFRDNQLSTVTIGNNVTSIGDRAFRGNKLTTVISTGNNPADIANDSFDARSTIDLVIPVGTEMAYQTKGWGNFSSVTILGVNDTPSFTMGLNQMVNKNAVAQTVADFVKDINDGDPEVEQILTFNVSADNIDLFSVQPVISATGTLMYTPATDAVGTTIISVSLSDDGGGMTDKSADQIFEITLVDNTAPLVTSITRQSPTTKETNADELVWNVIFNEGVQNVDTADFTTTRSTATVTNVTNSIENTYQITVSGGNLANFNGTIVLGFVDVSAGRDITDITGNLLADTRPKEVNQNGFRIDNRAPRILSIIRQNPIVSPTNLDTLTWDIAFNEAVNSVDITDFTITGSTATITSVANLSGKIYRVSASGGNLSGFNGTVALGFSGTQDITDLANNSLSNLTPTRTNDNTFDVGNPSSVNLSVSEFMATEASAIAITVTATADKAVVGDQTVNLGVSGINITGTDYTLSNTTITILDGETEGVVMFTIQDDTLVEETETATLTISNPSIGLALGTITNQNIVITDNDFPSIAYNGPGFTETSANDGSVTGSISAALTGDTFKNPLTIGTDVTLGNIPLGLTPNINIQEPASIWTARSAAENNRWSSVTYGNGLFVAVSGNGTNQVMTSPDGITWMARLAAENNQWRSVTYGNGLFVAVSHSGTNRVMTSPDGIIWTARSAAENNSWISVTYGNGLFVAVGFEGTNRVMTSPDGIIWTARLAAENNEWFSVTYGSGLFVAVSSDYSGTGNNRIMTSLDGITWTARTPVSGNWLSVTYGNDLFVAVSNDRTNRVMTASSESIATLSLTDNATSHASTNNVADITFDFKNSAFTNFDANDVINAVTASSNLGVNFKNTFLVNLSVSEVTATEASATAIRVTATADKEVIGNQTVNLGVSGINITGTDYTLSNTTITILDGETEGVVTFSVQDDTLVEGTETATLTISNPSSEIALGTTTSQNIVITDNDFPSIAYNGPGFTETSANDGSVTGSISVALTGDIFKNPLTIGTDVTLGNIPLGLTPNINIQEPASIWTARSAAENDSWSSVTYGNGLFVAVSYYGADGTNQVMTSPDGITWTPQMASEQKVWSSVTYGNGLFVAVGNTAVMTSSDGFTWTTRLAAENNYWTSVTYGNGLFVAVGAYGTNQVMTSPDGIIWTARSAVENNQWRSVTYGNGLFVAVSSNGTNRVMTSPDGIIWTARSAAGNNYWYSVTYGNGLFVAVSVSGINQVMTSPNGITWTARSATETSEWSSVTYGSGLFVAVSADYFRTGNNRIMTSLDGITWTARTPVSGNWLSVTYGNDLFVAVSNNRTNRVMTASSESIATLSLTDNATSHASTNNVADITFDFKNSAFTNFDANDVINAVTASSNLGVNFKNKILVNLSVSEVTATEASATAITVTATADKAVVGDQTVNLGVSGINITGTDYTLSNTTITILDGETEGVVTFTVQDDSDIEGVETAILTISNPSSEISLGATTSQNIVITDNDSVPFITKWVTIGFNESITIPTTGAGYNYTVDWGDSTITTETGNATHSYGLPGRYTVSITGIFPRIYFNEGGDRNKILSIEQWGNNAWSSMAFAFAGCNALLGNFTDAPDLSNVTNMSSMFQEAYVFNTPIDNWDVSTITHMRGLFGGAIAFNQDLNDWEVANVEDMAGMFNTALAFNGAIGNWDVQNVTTMEGMFFKANKFNQNIENWKVDKVETMYGMFEEASLFNQPIGDWNVAKVEDMRDLFKNATAFNQNIGAWNVFGATNMEEMFEDAASFNQNLENWNVSNVLNMSRMFRGVTLSTTNYDTLLIGWNAQNLKPNINFHGGNSKYCVGATARANMIATTGDSWNIFDGGLECPLIEITADTKSETANEDDFVVSFQVGGVGDVLRAKLDEVIGGEKPTKTVFSVACGLTTMKVNRNWTVKNPGSTVAVNLSFNLTGISNPGDFDLLIDSDGDFKTTIADQTTIISLPANLSGTDLSFTEISLSDGDVFTLVRKTGYDITYNGTSWIDDFGMLDEPNLTDGNKQVIVKSNVTAPTNFNCTCLKIEEKDPFLSPVHLTIPDGQFINTDELVLDGGLYLEGDAELIQTTVNAHVNSGTGHVYKIIDDATDSLYEYNFMSAPVNTGGNFTLSGNLKFNTGGTLANNTNPSFTQSLDGSSTTLSTRWTHTLNNSLGFVEINENETMLPGIGFTMKGTGEANKYNFIGTPNNGAVDVPLTAGNFLLTGNPYPSTLDANAFNIANNMVTDGVIYLWDQPNAIEHFNGFTDESGGYATITNGITVAAAVRSDGTTALPERTDLSKIRTFIKPGQGFVVYGATTGSVKFKNRQRTKVYDGDRHFFKTKKQKSLRSVLRLGFEYNTENNQVYHRQLATVLEGGSIAKEVGKDAFMFDYYSNDAYWVLPEELDRFIITSVPYASDILELPIGVVVDKNREIRFMLDNKEAIGKEVYLYDKQEGQITDISNNTYTANVAEGDHQERFSLVFSEQITLGTEVNNSVSKTIISVNNGVLNVVLKKGDIKEIKMFSYSGKEVLNYTSKSRSNYMQTSVKELNSQFYIVVVKTNKETINKKVFIE